MDAGFEADHAGDGEEALARVRQNTYDLVICDPKMQRVG
jgi:CheY-like chemotaxis protein